MAEAPIGMYDSLVDTSKYPDAKQSSMEGLGSSK